MKNFQISASLLAANFACLGQESKAVLKAGADMIHIDVMDNHYVPNLTMGPMVCSALREYGIKASFDVHLMVKPVDSLIEAFAKAGADYITIHPEATQHLHRSLATIRALNCKAGIALNPATPLNFLDHILADIDLILVMSVNPGFGGQSFIPEALNKIKAVKQRLVDYPKIRLEVDGGINIQNIASVAQAGADIFVIGSALFNTEDYAVTISKFREKLHF